jgi:DeoR family transcriptional regulator of aga operon
MKERQKKMVKLINDSGAISFSQLKIAFPNVSDMTIRNDLKALDELKLIVRVHGGAKSVDRIIGTDDVINKRLIRNVEKKNEIANKAVKLLDKGTSVFLDSGSTLTSFAQKIPDQSHLIFTSGMPCAMELAKLQEVHLFIIGGKINKLSMSVYGSNSCDRIKELNYDIAFLGTTGFIKGIGFNCGSDEEASLKRSIISRADKVVILMDSTKVDISNPFNFASVYDIDIVVSDNKLEETLVKYFQNNNVEVR